MFNHNNNNNYSALIVARPDRRRDSLRALLNAVPQLKIITDVDDATSAMKKISLQHPNLVVLLGLNLPDEEIEMVLTHPRPDSFKSRYLVLADTLRQQHIAATGKADGMLKTGFTIDEFIGMANRLLS